MQEITAIIQQLNRVFTGSIPVHILRIDQVHPVVSGNKWFKLSRYLSDAVRQHADTIATFGGAYSNHIVAAAFAAREQGLKSIGFVRGEAAPHQPTVEEARDYGMDIRFVTRDAYRDKNAIMEQYAHEAWHWIPEGGYGIPGAEGAADILATADTGRYSHIVCAAGTGTMMAGLVKAAQPHQTVLGISVLKNAWQLEIDISQLLTQQEQQRPFSVVHGYDFGGYAKHPPELISFMREVWEKEALPTDIVYTSKLVFAAQDLVNSGYFPRESQLLLIHSGGLQGNRSLPPHTLPF